jgi:hypothetical protein
MSILKTQNFIGQNFDTRRQTLDWRIRNLRELEVIFDDFNCPDINFTWNILENDPVLGILAEYLVEITPPGTIDNFRLDFGDGEFTTTELSGQHRYAINARIDPIIRVSNEKCQIIQTPIERINPAEPFVEDEVDFEIPIPEIPPPPEFNFVPCEVPEPDYALPPLVTPCVSLDGQINIPSIISGPNINMVSNVVITANEPINITQSTVTITGTTLPSVIVVDMPPIPPTIVVDPPIPPTIVIVPQQSNIALDLNADTLPRIEVDWGTPPQMEVAMTFAREVQTPQRFAADEELLAEFGDEFSDLFETSQTMKVEYESVGVPSEIKVIVPNDTSVKLDTRELDQKKIKIDASEVNIPQNIKIHGPDAVIPDSIVFEVGELNQVIDRLESIKPIQLDASGIPDSIELKMEKEIPKTILVEMPKPIPEKIMVESNIPDKIVLEGPEGIPLLLPDDFALPVKFPEQMPEIELVWRGSPIEVKVTMDEITNKDADGKNCVMIVPCKS